ncbi:MAG: hypothetical protein Q4D07_04640 [Selenomonadaceae bacterium]|nr:hypothetical protein [Selenomonadaceae bacterium]
MAIFDFFGGSKEAEDVKEPQQPQPPKQPEPQQPTRPAPRSKDAIKDKNISIGLVSSRLQMTIGTDNLDVVLDKLAPETMDCITELKANQLALYEKMQEHEEWMRRLESKLDFISSVVGDIAEKTLGRAYPKPNDYDDAEHK